MSRCITIIFENSKSVDKLKNSGIYNLDVVDANTIKVFVDAQITKEDFIKSVEGFGKIIETEEDEIDTSGYALVVFEEYKDAEKCVELFNKAMYKGRKVFAVLGSNDKVLISGLDSKDEHLELKAKAEELGPVEKFSIGSWEEIDDSIDNPYYTRIRLFLTQNDRLRRDKLLLLAYVSFRIIWFVTTGRLDGSAGLIDTIQFHSLKWAMMRLWEVGFIGDITYSGLIGLTSAIYNLFW